MQAHPWRPACLRPAAVRRWALAALSRGARWRLDRRVLLEHRLLGRQSVGVGRPFGLDRSGIVHQPGLDRLFRTGVAALSHTCTLADAIAQVVELRAAHVAAGGDLDALDLRRVHGEHALHAYAEGLLAHGERLARAVALALDHDALEDLHPTARALDDLEVHLDAVAGREVGNAAQLRALDGFDDAAHNVKEVAP